jgi:hypothetical protein
VVDSTGHVLWALLTSSWRGAQLEEAQSGAPRTKEASGEGSGTFSEGNCYIRQHAPGDQHSNL